MEFDAFELTIDDGVAHIIWNQPECGNPFDGTFCREYSALAVECDENPRVRAVLMEARGRLLSTFDQPLETQIELEAQALARMARTDDAWNALQAVARREKAVFAGR